MRGCLPQLLTKIIHLFHFRWHILAHPKDVLLLTLSSSACEMLLFVKGRFQILREQLASSIFSVVWKQLAQALNEFIFEEVRDMSCCYT